MRLTTKVFLFFVGLILFVSAICTLSAFILIDRTVLGELHKRLSSDVNLLTFSIERELLHMEQDLLAAAKETGYLKASPGGHKASLEALMDEALSGSDIGGVTVTDEEGRVLAERHSGPRQYVISPRPAGNRVAAGFSTASSDAGDRPALAVSLPLVLRNGRPGRINAATVLENNNPFLAKANEILARTIEEPVFVSIFFREQRLLSSLVPSGELQRNPLPPEIAGDLFERGKEFFGPSTIKGKPYLVMYKPAMDISGHPVWAYGIAVSEKVLSAGRRSLLHAFLLISLFATAAAIALAFVLTRGINPSLKEVVERCSDIEAGSLTARVDTTRLRVEEFRIIGSAFNKLASYIADREATIGGNIEAIEKINADLKETSKQVRAERKKYLIILETMEDGVATLDEKGVVTYFNRAAESITGIDRHLVIGRHHHRFLPGLTVVDSGSPRTEELAIDDPALSLYLNMYISPYASETGEKGHVLLFRDISKQKKIEEFKADFISAIAHDIKSLLVPVKGFLKRILEQKYGPVPGPVSERISAVSDNTAKIFELVENYLNVSRIESGRMELALSPCDITEVVVEAAQLYGPRVLTRTEKDIPLALVDRGYIERVLANLIANALKFSPEEAPVVVAARKEGAVALISVEDKGVGIPPDELQYIFERYRMGTFSRQAGGSGLGLFIAKSIVKAHGGNIWVESTVGKGSTFFFTLPLFVGEP